MQVSKDTQTSTVHVLTIEASDEELAELASALKAAKRGVRYQEEGQFAAIQNLRNAIDGGSRVVNFR